MTKKPSKKPFPEREDALAGLIRSAPTLDSLQQELETVKAVHGNLTRRLTQVQREARAATREEITKEKAELTALHTEAVKALQRLLVIVERAETAGVTLTREKLNEVAGG